MASELYRPVGDLMRQVARDVVMPRFRNLRAEDISEKAANDFVTIADKESEERLAEGLARILPEAGMVGEEACAADPSILARAGEGLNWIIDPIDGTGNYAAGQSPFALMIALADGGSTLAGWIYDPVVDRMCHATLGAGAMVNDERIVAKESEGPLPVAALAVSFVPPQEREQITRNAAGRFDIVAIPRCAGEQYPRIALGANDVSIFSRTLPWDHAAGTLFLNEAGGRSARMDGSDYRIGDPGFGLLGASSPRMWDLARATLYA